MSDTATAATATAATASLVAFAKTYLGIEFDSTKNEFFSFWGQYSSTPGARRVRSLEEIKEKFESVFTY